MKLDKCRSCGAPIIWALTKNKKRMPVDAETTPDGNLEIVEDDGQAVVLSVEASPLFPCPRHTSHFATCPEAAKWRRK